MFEIIGQITVGALIGYYGAASIHYLCVRFFWRGKS